MKIEFFLYMYLKSLINKYLSQGLILKKVHRILEFKQSPWMKPYIDFNTEKRKKANNEADKNLFKLLINAVYRKTVENKRKRINIRITTKEKHFTEYVSRPTYISYKQFGENLFTIHEKRELLILDKPIYAGASALELSKLAMYKFWYEFVKRECKKCVLLFTDTDSLCFETEEDFYEIMHKFYELFDLSNFPKDSKYFRNDNKKVPGKMKDEYGGTAIYEFIGTNSKMYSILDVNNCEKSACKGHTSNIRNAEFKNTLFIEKVIRHTMKGIKSFNHRMHTYESNKISLSVYDYKRYICSDGIHTLAYGHKDILRNE